MVRSGVNHLNHTRAGQASHNLIDHHQVVANLDKKMESNRSDISQGENPTMAPVDGVIDTLPKHFEERSSILIEPTKPVNIGREEESKVIYLAQSLSLEERKEFIEFFKER